ncbi:VOC family protein [uncultured Chryseobacterium sp.]|uniref:VOC family protein n=1 Tax=uncultured Chryseobacterium sp. TaxID=259322 RepID=UPI0025F28EE7|nr:VOC family protein [uncultured Chryseobacterium sp.]
MIKIKYAHTNIITKDWKKLAKFYEIVFNCIPVPPIRNYQGEWLDKGTGVVNAQLEGIQLRLPGYGDNGPTLEIYQYSEMINTERHMANQKGFGHIAFRVDDIAGLLALALTYGASKIGELSEHHFDNMGMFKFIYISDPDGNIIELLNWS